MERFKKKKFEFDFNQSKELIAIWFKFECTDESITKRTYPAFKEGNKIRLLKYRQITIFYVYSGKII